MVILTKFMNLFDDVASIFDLLTRFTVLILLKFVSMLEVVHLLRVHVFGNVVINHFVLLTIFCCIPKLRVLYIPQHLSHSSSNL